LHDTDAESEAETIARLEAETAAAAEAENDALRRQMASCAFIAALMPISLLLALLSAMFGRSLFPSNSNGIAWAVIEAPLIVYAAIVFRRGRFKLRDGRVYEGWTVRAAAVLAVLVSLAVFWVRVIA
jgi:cation transport ATPase